MMQTMRREVCVFFVYHKSKTISCQEATQSDIERVRKAPKCAISERERPLLKKRYTAAMLVAAVLMMNPKLPICASHARAEDEEGQANEAEQL